MAEVLAPYRVYAVKYATREAPATECFLGAEAHDPPRRMDYYVWAVVNDHHAVVVDTGFSELVARARGREFLRCPIDSLTAVGIDPAGVRHVVLSHMHYDHVGNVEKLPGATIYLQAVEMAFYTGPYARYARFARSIEVDDVLALVRANYAGRLRLLDGEVEIVPGVRAYWLGGHTAGLQVVRVHTERGNLVLAADASHYYANFREYLPFPTLHDLPGCYRAFDRLRALADSPNLIIPGHDPLVMERYPAVSPETDFAVRLA